MNNEEISMWMALGVVGFMVCYVLFYGLMGAVIDNKYFLRIGVPIVLVSLLFTLLIGKNVIN